MGKVSNRALHRLAPLALAGGLAVLWAWPGGGAMALMDNFNVTATNATMDGKASLGFGGTWDTLAANSQLMQVVAVSPGNELNRVLRVGGNLTVANGPRTAGLLQTRNTINDGEMGTLFLQLYLENNAITNLMLGLQDNATAVTNLADLGGKVFLLTVDGVSGVALKDESGATLVTLTNGIWYNLWWVINRGAGGNTNDDTFDLYLNTGTNGATAAHRIGAGLTLTGVGTNGIMGPCVRVGPPCSAGNYAYVDNLYFDGDTVQLGHPLSLMLPQLSVTATDPVASEPGADPGAFTLMRSGDTNSSVTVAFTLGGTATSNVDYTLSPASPLTLAAGQTNLLLILTPLDDSLPEADETVVLTLTADPAYALDYPAATITIRDDNDAGALAWYYFNENNNTAASLAAAAAATIPDPAKVLALNAVAGSGLGLFGSGSGSGNQHGYGTSYYVSPPSALYVRATVTASDASSAVAGDKFVSFTLGPRAGYALTLTGLSAQVKMHAPATNSLTVFVRSSLDGFGTNVASLTVAGNTTVNTFTALIQNLSGAGFVALLAPVEFRFYFYDDSNNSGDIPRMDDVGFFGTAGPLPPGAQVITVAATDPAASEPGTDTGAFTLTRYGDTNQAVTVYYTLGGTASNGLDYAWLSGSALIAPGVTNLLLPVVPLDDTRPELTETVILTLSTSAAYIIADSPTAIVNIADDNELPEFTLTATAPFAWEGTPGIRGQFTISRWLGDTNAAVQVRLAFSGTASNGVDYTADATNEVFFDAGVISRQVTITPLDDPAQEGSETVVLTLLPGAGYTVGAPAAATVTLADDESAGGASLLLEAESFTNAGGWVVDQQFIETMGSPYLLAHGYGNPVADAVTTVAFPGLGTYRLWVRTKDWTAPLTNHPGTFNVVVGGVEAAAVFGTEGQGWLWQDGGMVLVTNPVTEVRLRDLTGFDGRCDALFFTSDPGLVPPGEAAALQTWRRAQLGLPEVPPPIGDFDVDLVVVGGGLSGTAAAVAAARQGLVVALLQDRPWLGGNCSQDVRVHTMGDDLGGIVAELNTPNYLIGSDQFKLSDQTRHQVVQRETNILLFTEWRAFGALTNGDRIVSVDARHMRTGEERRFTAPFFIDSTGDGWLGFWAGASFRMGREARAEFNESLAPTNADRLTMGSTLSWYSANAGSPVAFPAVPWATNVSKSYYALRGDWYWEYGLTLDTIYDAEEIRDHLLQAIYGTFWNVKQSATNANRALGWVAYIAGKRESRRLMGDYVLTEFDARNRPAFSDAVVLSSWGIDLHYPQGGQYDFIAVSQNPGITPFWIPFRCLYSTNIANLMMAGRCLSCTHVGLGSPRVMNTGGQMGVATGTAAALCKKYNTTPRGVYQRHLQELRTLMNLVITTDTPTNTVCIIDDADTNQVQLTGPWTISTATSGYYGTDYLHDGNTNKGAKSARFTPDLPLRGDYQVYVRWTAGSNRATNAPFDILHRNGTNTVVMNQTNNNGQWMLLGTYPFELGGAGSVLLRNDATTGYVVADAVAFAAAFALDPAFTGNPWEDDDADGVCNYVEWLNGTDPLNPLSYLKVRLQARGGPPSLRFVTRSGRAYTIQYRDAMPAGAWQTLLNVPAATFTQEQEFMDPQPLTNKTRFYRLLTLPGP